MINISEQLLEQMKKEFSQGTRVELLILNDRFLKIDYGERGTVLFVDDFGTIHVRWDCGISCGIVFGEDKCKKIEINYDKKLMEINCGYYCDCIEATIEVFSNKRENLIIKRYARALCA